MKKGNEYAGKVTAVAFPDKGIVCAEGERVIVKRTIPGQTVSFILSKNKENRKEGRLLEVIERSPMERFDDCCGVYEKCGGCIYQTIGYDDELKIKRSQLVTLFDNFFRSEPLYAGVSAEDLIKTVIPSPVLKGYRNKMEYSFGDEVKGGELTLGMHVRGHFNDIVNTEGCSIANPDFETIRSFSRDFFASSGLPFYHRNSGEGFLRHLLVRAGVKTGEILVCIVTTDPAGHEDVLDSYAKELLSLFLNGKIGGVLNIVTNGVADAVKADGIRLLYGRDHFYEEVLGLKFKITPFSFFQTNTLGAEVLYKTAADLIPVKGTVFDLYSGTGTIAQVLASRCERVFGIEIVEEAVLAARENAALNGIKNAEFIAGDVLKVLESMDVRPDVIVMDPPRDGASPKALKKILSYGVENILYISCKITSFIRDLRELTDSGYRIKSVVPIDLFPRTGNVETVVCLSKGDVKSKKIRVEFSLEDMDTDGFKKGATYNAIRDWIKAKYGYRVTNLNIAQVKQKHGIIEDLIHSTETWTEFLSPDLEDLMFGDSKYLENNAFSTSHQSVNVYGLPEKCYEVRTEDTAVDVQIHKASKNAGVESNAVEDPTNNIEKEDYVDSYQLKEELIPEELRKDAIDLPVKGAIKGWCYLVPYEGKLKSHTIKKTEGMFIPLMRNGQEKMVSVSVVSEDRIIYISQDMFKLYEQVLSEPEGIIILKGFF